MLTDTNLTLLRNKLVEEAQELAEAEEPDHVAAECADLMYFAMTRCVAAGVSLDQVEAHLDRRSLKLNRRPGNDKKERIDAAASILAAKKGGAAAPATGGGRVPKWAPIAVAVAALALVGMRSRA